MTLLLDLTETAQPPRLQHTCCARILHLSMGHGCGSSSGTRGVVSSRCCFHHNKCPTMARRASCAVCFPRRPQAATVLSAQDALSPNISMCMQVTCCVAGVRSHQAFQMQRPCCQQTLWPLASAGLEARHSNLPAAHQPRVLGTSQIEPSDEHGDGLRFRQPGNAKPAFISARADLQTGAHAWGARPHDLRTVIQSPVAQSAPCPGYRCRPADGLCAPAQPPYELLQGCGRAPWSS